MKKIIQILFILLISFFEMNSQDVKADTILFRDINYFNSNFATPDTMLLCSGNKLYFSSSVKYNSLTFRLYYGTNFTNPAILPKKEYVKNGFNIYETDFSNADQTFIDINKPMQVTISYTVTNTSTNSNFTMSFRFIVLTNKILTAKPLDLSVCNNDGSISLKDKLFPTSTGLTWQYYQVSGNGVSNSMFFPGTFLPNTIVPIKTVYTLPSYNNGICTYTSTSTILVKPNPELVYADTQSVCQGTTFQLNANANDAIYTSANAQTTVSSSGLLNVANSGGKVVLLSRTVNGCRTNGNMSINVKATPSLSVSDISKCSNNPSFTLNTGTPTGGIYKNANNTTITTFNPNGLSGAYPISYTLTGSNSCSNTKTFNINVYTPTAIVNTKLSDKTCTNSGALTLGDISPTGGTWSGTGVSANKFTSTNTGTFTLTYTFTDANTCVSTTTRNMLVNAFSSISLPTTTDSICKDLAPFFISVNPVGGAWTSSSPILLTSNGNIDPSKATNILNTLNYTYIDANTCTSTATKTIRVYDKLQINFGAQQKICKGSIANLSVISPTGGTWSGPNVANGKYNATSLGVGSYPVTYTFKNIGCVNSATKTVIVNNPVTANAGNDTTACRVKTEFDFTDMGTPKGGIWSGVGVSNNILDPSVQPVGTKNYKYTFTDTSGCSASDSIVVIFANSLALPQISFTGQNFLCLGDSVELNASVSNSTINTTYRWYRDADTKPFAEGNKVKVTGINSFFIYCESWTASKNGCPSGTMSLQQITVKKPSGDFSIDKTNLKFGEKIKITTTITAASYEYDFGDGLKSIEKSPIHYYYPAQTDTFTVKLTTTSSDGCVSVFEKPMAVKVLGEADTTTTNDNSVLDNASINKTGYLAVYPNPTEGKLTIDVYGNDVNNLDYSIVDNQGIEVKSETFKYASDAYILDLSSLKSGAYTLKLKYQDNVKTSLIIKK